MYIKSSIALDENDRLYDEYMRGIHLQASNVFGKASITNSVNNGKK